VSLSIKDLHGSAITGNRTRTSVSGVVRRNQVPRLKVGTRWGYIAYVYTPVLPEQRALAVHPLLAKLHGQDSTGVHRTDVSIIIPTTGVSQHFPYGTPSINSGKTRQTRVIHGGPITYVKVEGAI
jgi:hypothetical protein